MKIEFFSEKISFKIKGKQKVRKWIDQICTAEKKSVSSLSFIFCSDDYLLEINKKFLQHNYFTDIITFPYSDENSISGDIFISIDRVKENAIDLNIAFEKELHRVIIHGVLHLLGYKDHSKKQKNSMRAKENSCLDLLEK